MFFCQSIPLPHLSHPAKRSNADPLPSGVPATTPNPNPRHRHHHQTPSPPPSPPLLPPAAALLLPDPTLPPPPFTNPRPAPTGPPLSAATTDSDPDPTDPPSAQYRFSFSGVPACCWCLLDPAAPTVTSAAPAPGGLRVCSCCHWSRSRSRSLGWWETTGPNLACWRRAFLLPVVVATEGSGARVGAAGGWGRDLRFSESLVSELELESLSSSVMVSEAVSGEWVGLLLLLLRRE